MNWTVMLKKYRDVEIEAETEKEAETKAQELCEEGEVVVVAEQTEEGK